MPEFVMEGRDHAARAESDFVLGFIEALFFTETGCTPADEWFTTDEGERTSDGQLPCDVGYADLHPDSLAAIRRFCAAWQEENTAALARACIGDYDETQAGHDLWFTINGCGVGFWDRRGETEDASLALQELDQAAGRSEVPVFFGDHVTYGDAPFVHVDL